MFFISRTVLMPLKLHENKQSSVSLLHCYPTTEPSLHHRLHLWMLYGLSPPAKRKYCSLKLLVGWQIVKRNKKKPPQQVSPQGDEQLQRKGISKRGLPIGQSDLEGVQTYQDCNGDAQGGSRRHAQGWCRLSSAIETAVSTRIRLWVGEGHKCSCWEGVLQRNGRLQRVRVSQTFAVIRCNLTKRSFSYVHHIKATETALPQKSEAVSAIYQHQRGTSLMREGLDVLLTDEDSLFTLVLEHFLKLAGFVSSSAC